MCGTRGGSRGTGGAEWARTEARGERFERRTAAPHDGGGAEGTGDGHGEGQGTEGRGGTGTEE